MKCTYVVVVMKGMCGMHTGRIIVAVPFAGASAIAVDVYVCVAVVDVF